MVLGIVGEAGVGKTFAADFFASQGGYVISADLIVKDIYLLLEIKKEIFDKCGSQFLNSDGTINSLALRKAAFKNYQFLKKLEEIIWPKMIKIILKKIKEHQSEKLLIIDCAVLFNAKLDYLVDKILLVTADEDLKIKRIKKRDKVSNSEAKALLNLQKNHLILNKKNDFLIKNNGSNKDFIADLTNLLPKLIN